MSAPGMKRCSKCSEPKPLERFPKRENRCKDCVNTYKRSWYRQNSEKHREYTMNWRDANLEKYLADKKAWYENNKEQASAAGKLRYAKNKEARCDYNRIWRQNNSELLRLYKRRRRALLAGTTATLTEREWQNVWEDCDGLCLWCGEVATAMDHILPLSPRSGQRQGHHTKGNVVPSCGPCNSRKHNMDPLTFYFTRQLEGIEGAGKNDA